MNDINGVMIKTMTDGTEKQINPFTGTEVWYIPGRKNRPIFTGIPDTAQKLEDKPRDAMCNFCPAKYLVTPPEKTRLILQDRRYILQDRLGADAVVKQTAEFRRIPNLFEIVTIDYWKKNFQYRLTDKNRLWKERYLADEAGRRHVVSIIDLKLKYSGYADEDLARVTFDQKVAMSDAFFGGAHELIVPRRHFVDDAEYDSQLCSSGELTPEEHYQYFRFTIDAMREIYDNNRYIRYIAVYQNWRKEAGASFDHLHTQVVGLDEWGVSLERELRLASTNPNMYNEYAANYAAYNNNVVCENDQAIAFVDLGHRFPTIAIYSKSLRCRPAAQTREEVRGFSDLVHAVHAASGSQISCNEEWYYMPNDCIIPLPWHVLIKWRVNITAGFEGGTKIYVNPMSLKELRDKLVPRLFDLRDKGKLGELKIAEECPVKPNSLLYYKNDIE
jgi:galactose-1-phosphate uridylyltransferase